jgi:hypothetical protein
MITGTAISMGITIITIMIAAELCLVRRNRPALGALPFPIWGDGVAGKTERPKPLTPSLSQPLTPSLSLWEREPTESAARESLQ